MISVGCRCALGEQEIHHLALLPKPISYPTTAFGVIVTCKSSTTQYPAMKLVGRNGTIQRRENIDNQGTVLMTVLNWLLYKFWNFYWHKLMFATKTNKKNCSLSKVGLPTAVILGLDGVTNNVRLYGFR